VIALYDGAGAITAAYEYDPFGNQQTSAGTYAASNPFRSATKCTDAETGLVYYGLRYYSPQLGRFVHRDPIEEQGGVNLYAFCGNDPVNRCDLLGLDSIFDNFWNETGGGRAAVAEYMGDPQTRSYEYGGETYHVTNRPLDQLPDGVNIVAWGSNYELNSSGELVRGGSHEEPQAPNSELRETSGAGGSVALPTPTQDQVNGVVAVWSRYVTFRGSASDKQKLQTLFAQAVLFRRPNAKPSMAMREIVRVLVQAGDGRVSIGFGAGNETTRAYGGRSIDSFIRIENYSSGGRPISAEQMVVSIMHEMLHATDRIRGMSYMAAADRHNEIYRIQNQTLFDLGLPLDPGPGGRQVIDENGKPNGDKYIGPGW
jgi:RHS repeat-associated protein